MKTRNRLLPVPLQRVKKASQSFAHTGAKAI